MAKWEITQEGNKTTIKKNHPFWSGVVWFIAIALVLSGVLRAPWLIVPTILIVGGMVWLKVSMKAKVSAKNRPPNV